MSQELWISILWQGLVGSSLASIGFGVLFNVRGKSLYLAGLTGGIGGVIYKFCLGLGWQDPMANFAAAVTLSIFGEIFARRMKTTVTTFTACALIPLVPGGTAYEMMVEFSSDNPMAGISKTLDVISVSGMLAMGILTVSTLTRFFFYSKRQFSKTRLKLEGSAQEIRMKHTERKTARMRAKSYCHKSHGTSLQASSPARGRPHGQVSPSKSSGRPSHRSSQHTTRSKGHGHSASSVRLSSSSGSKKKQSLTQKKDG